MGTPDFAVEALRCLVEGGYNVVGVITDVYKRQVLIRELIYQEMIEDIKKACQVMCEGGVILYPTDTIWGLGCDATNEEAVRRVY